jgi:hypothetical protein
MAAGTLPLNAVVEYVEDGQVIARERFYDPGLDEESWYSRDLKARKSWGGPHQAYSCGGPG